LNRSSIPLTLCASNRIYGQKFQRGDFDWQARAHHFKELTNPAPRFAGMEAAEFERGPAE
jgi:O-acetylhomoserine/O-acetylserine sulfhydrylase-like pyridoxal-dependent enzyme